MVFRQAVIAAAILLALPSLASAAPKHRHHHRHITAPQAEIVCDRQGCRSSNENAYGRRSVARYESNSRDPRPAAWCGWQMRHWLGVADRAFNLARKWASYGTRAPGPAEGVVVVWPHHVGIITGRADGEWIVKSGNDGHAVRERPRSLRGVIAFRNPPQRYAGL